MVGQGPAAFIPCLSQVPRSTQILISCCKRLHSRAADAESFKNKHPPSQAASHIQLVFDINKTIIMTDPAGGKGQDQILNEILSEVSWGNLQGGSQGGDSQTWEWNQEPPLPGVALLTSGLVSYSSLVHRSHSDVPGQDNAVNKQRRDHLKGTFTEIGQPGHGLREHFLCLREALRLPPRASHGKLAEAAGLAGRSSYHIVPAFFECLVGMKDSGRDFSLQFRTFGEDLPRVAVEFNAFCEGRHPLYEGVRMDGSDGQPDRRIHLHDPAGFGAFYRDAQRTELYLGTLDPSTPPAAARSRAASAGLKLPSVQSIFAHMVGRSTSQSSTLALRDYYPWWRSNLEAGWAGKLLPVDLAPGAVQETICFDDNIEHDNAHIIDVRDKDSGDSEWTTGVPFATAKVRQLVRAEPYNVILGANNNFFTLHIEERGQCSGLE